MGCSGWKSSPRVQELREEGAWGCAISRVRGQKKELLLAPGSGNSSPGLEALVIFPLPELEKSEKTLQKQVQ